MTFLRWAGATALGLYLFAVPFLRYSGAGHGGEAHMNHESRHGGQLGMVGDHHIEIRTGEGVFEAFISDARRLPLVPAAGEVAFDSQPPVRMHWESYRLVARGVSPSRDAEVHIVLDDGTELVTTFDVSEPVRDD